MSRNKSMEYDNVSSPGGPVNPGGSDSNLYGMPWLMDQHGGFEEGGDQLDRELLMTMLSPNESAYLDLFGK